MKKLLAIVLLLTMVLSMSAYGEGTKTLKDYERVDTFNAMVTSGGIADEEFNSQKLANTIRTATGYNV